MRSQRRWTRRLPTVGGGGSVGRGGSVERGGSIGRGGSVERGARDATRPVGRRIREAPSRWPPGMPLVGWGFLAATRARRDPKGGAVVDGGWGTSNTMRIQSSSRGWTVDSAGGGMRPRVTRSRFRTAWKGSAPSTTTRCATRANTNARPSRFHRGSEDRGAPEGSVRGLGSMVLRPHQALGRLSGGSNLFPAHRRRGIVGGVDRDLDRKGHR